MPLGDIVGARCATGAIEPELSAGRDWICGAALVRLNNRAVAPGGEKAPLCGRRPVVWRIDEGLTQQAEAMCSSVLRPPPVRVFFMLSERPAVTSL